MRRTTDFGDSARNPFPAIQVISLDPGTKCLHVDAVATFGDADPAVEDVEDVEDVVAAEDQVASDLQDASTELDWQTMMSTKSLINSTLSKN